ncbi:hepatocyte growth factor activator serine protease-like [Branchiostoma floridae x Branchiostoma belcheri]
MPLGDTPGPSVADSCSSNPCRSGGTCQDDGTGYTCVCPPYFAGRNCETVWQSDKCYRFSDDSLSNQEASNTCVTMGGHLADIQETAQQQLLASFMDPARDASFWTANKISLSAFGDGSVLSATPTWMYNNGSIDFDICVLLNSGYGYKGTYQCCEEQHNYICQSPAGPCQPNVCQHGGYCVSCFGQSSTFCICPQGYSGPFCEIADLCHPNPCPFDWICSTQAGGIHCAVPTGVKSTRSGFCTATSCGSGLICIEDGRMGFSCIRG